LLSESITMSTDEPNDREPEVDPFEQEEWIDDPREPREARDGAPDEDAPDEAPGDREHPVVRRPNPLPSREEEEEELAEADIHRELDPGDPAIGDERLDL
jgi:hypothetical protein